uniref:RRM domain-containing protein n=1 Tax=Chromera velia CCMP2878 TaxID=1169474 RepID=A0A0G4I891_9ALVE|eukprot:Cvel_11871.t1-p1 / transcript=Cvel_11871.t1 / gene=Cvel_11871 / organism=Chromera_velia_CCMP2878 / gene_product=Polypyrimidine tract-binding protein homolog 3, putative / transcript_product=Polypyrimidine tract-binding protein homolog 3, putative / location=Cvel_scaffold758:9635-18460(+) / protein_length=572 / sequence_SO=supercontig / SO=protein_coding / is_pseudo=false
MYGYGAQQQVAGFDPALQMQQVNGVQNTMGMAGMGGPVTHGAGMQMQKPTDTQVPTKVLYIRNVADSVSENDVMGLCSQFGTVSQVLLLKEKRHGFVEFMTDSEAMACHNAYRGNAPMVHGRPLEFSWSGRTQIEKKHDPADNPPNRILLVTVTNISYPVTVDVFTQILNTNYGPIQKIIIFSKDQKSVQALIQLPDVGSASRAKADLDGQNIYANCNTLKINFSSSQQLVIKFNSERSMDFTVAGGAPQAADPVQAGGGLMPAPGAVGGPSGGFMQAQQQQQQMPGGATLRAGPGAPTMGGMMMQGGMPGPFGGFGNPLAGAQARPMGNMMGMGGPPGAVGGMAMNGGGAMGMGGAGNQPIQGAGGNACVLMVRGLVEGHTKPIHLANLFAVYANVERVKVLFHKRDQALVQVENMQQGTNAKTNLNGCDLFGKKIMVDFFRTQGQQSSFIPPPQQGGAGGEQLTQDFTDQSYRRHKPDKALRAFTPSNTVHVANCPDGTSEQNIRDFFVGCGDILGVRSFHEKGHQWAVTFGSVNTAVETVAVKGGSVLGGRPVRLGFSSSAVGGGFGGA